MRRKEPEIPEGITGKELDRAVWHQLRTLTKENAEGVAQHLAAAAMLLEDEPDLALDHAQTAVRRAGRVPAAREALGLVLYRRGEFSDALREFRTARRLSGSDHLLPYMVDAERGLGRLERALELASSPEAKRLPEADNIELAIVVSGVRRDLGQPEAALMGLRIPALNKLGRQPWAARLSYAYAEALLATGDEDGAHEWFSKALTLDAQQETDAAERIAELEGVVLEDLLEGEDDIELGDEDLSEDETAETSGDERPDQQA
ncbi:tetratricopeptide repeat protein [Barrientosiimonas humi]|uniref:tetratricopeptide repeat protein n=1 Tax=Barrientosiimonas humi TaxID=999931 RepID=UPI00370D41ED